MMRFSKVIRASVVIVMLMGGATAAYAADACRNVKFKFTNEKNHTIKVISVKYFNQANNKFQTETIKNVSCAAGATCTTKGDNLRDAEGEDLTKLIFVLKNEAGENRHDTGEKVLADPKCSADKTYGPMTITAND